jgi:hypothetical protein
LLAFDDGKNLCCRLLPALLLSYPCPLQEVLLAISLPVFSKVFILLLTNFQMDLELSQGDLKGVVYFLDACASLQIPPVFISSQLICNICSCLIQMTDSGEKHILPDFKIWQLHLAWVKYCTPSSLTKLILLCVPSLLVPRVCAIPKFFDETMLQDVFL